MRGSFKKASRCVVLLGAVLMFFAMACGKGQDKNPDVLQKGQEASETVLDKVAEKVSGGDSEQGTEPAGYAFEAQYIRTDGGFDEAETPYYVLIESREELDAYYEANKDIFDLERKDAVYSDTTIGFLDACDKYDEAYFEKRNLLLIVLTEPSGSIRHRIADVRQKNESEDWIVSIETIEPEIGTDDMATWHLFLEVQMGKVITAEDIVHINLDNDWRIIGHGVLYGGIDGSRAVSQWSGR